MREGWMEEINTQDEYMANLILRISELERERDSLREALERSHAQLKEYQRFAGQSAAYDDLLNQNEQALSRSTENPNV